MRKKFIALFIIISLFSACSKKQNDLKNNKPPLSKAILEKIEKTNNGFILNLRVKNAGKSFIISDFTKTLQAKTSNGKNAIYEIGDLLLVRVENQKITHKELNIKNFNKSDGRVIRSEFKRDKSKIQKNLPKETKLNF